MKENKLHGSHPRAGLNGNVHQDEIFTLEGALTYLGVTYLGEGNWELPEGAYIRPMGGEDWILTLADGKEYHVWSED